MILYKDSVLKEKKKCNKLNTETLLRIQPWKKLTTSAFTADERRKSRQEQGTTEVSKF